MHLIAPLMAGIRGADNGTASLYKRGTSTRAKWYLDFEGTSSVASGDDIALDEYGSAVVYVNELVTVTVKDSSGVTLRSFVAGDASGNVEVRSQSFTGVDYDTGASAASNPTTLQSVLDAWKTSAGALDFKVNVGGTATLLKTAIGASPFYNVTDSAYGATGDGTTDDTSAIQAAVDAAAADGGGTVFFPAGTYRVTANIDCKGARLLGSSPSESLGATSDTKLVMDVASSANMLTDPATVEYMTIYADNASWTGSFIEMTDTNLVVSFAGIGTTVHTMGAGGPYITNSTAAYSVRLFNAHLIDSDDADLVSTTGDLLAIGCELIVRNARTGTPITAAGNSFVMGCRLGDTAASGNYTMLDLSGADGATVVGNYFEMGSSGTSVAVETPTTANAEWVVSGNTFVGADTKVKATYTTTNSVPAGNRSYGSTTTSDSTITVDAGRYQAYYIAEDTSATLTISASNISDLAPGEELVIFVSGAGATTAVDFSATYFEGEHIAGTASLSVNSGNVAVWRFMRTDASTTVLYQVGAALEYTP